MEELYGRPQRAEDGYLKALQVKPDLGAAANTLAYLMLENRESTDEALYLARIARQRMPDSPSTADTLAWAYYQKAHYDMAASTARSRAEGALPEKGVTLPHAGEQAAADRRGDVRVPPGAGDAGRYGRAAGPGEEDSPREGGSAP